MDIVIRPATESDLHAVLGLIKELAVYEKEPKAVVVTDEDFLRYFRNNHFECLVAELDEEVVGMALYYMAYSTWKGPYIYLEDFIIKEKLRRKGVGKALLAALVEIAEDRQVPYLKWQVLDWNKPALEFYKKLKAEVTSEWMTGWLHRKQFKGLLK